MEYFSKNKQSLNKSLGLEESKSSSNTQDRSKMEEPYFKNKINNLNNSDNYTKNKISSSGADQKQSFHSDSNQSDTSAIIRMNQNIKKRILRNHLMLILLLNLVQIGSLLFSIIYPPWYNDSENSPTTNGSFQEQTYYGLLFHYNNNSYQLNGFYSEDNKEIGGISSFIMFSMGVAIQFIYTFQLLAFFKSYPESIQNRGCKLLKFKTCRWLCLFLYMGAILYWVMVVYLVQVVGDTSNTKQLQYGFWISISCIASFLLICIYFNFVKKKIKKNDLVSNLLNANRYLKMNEEIDSSEQF
ncbi:transmembrane protein, putative (macronuclear) [Tetrahymena thermophila SB210]|uniref:Transmembrane protein, putative n=1 Tax=Tetrahymena thermophila (strain SB210) TaxID=312017 RepID=I7MGT6_TETTS|nr:transmembrane protein, putative [Tetrahymena thermophila SB210]EAR85446.2 transmembrane protein, putative [Tetrahymena thermophila SB210]|eukprot:XP_001033109.2 transmembrane protein, putative [Tetrahymena thermophila SB210]